MIGLALCACGFGVVFDTFIDFFGDFLAFVGGGIIDSTVFACEALGDAAISGGDETIFDFEFEAESFTKGDVGAE